MLWAGASRRRRIAPSSSEYDLATEQYEDLHRRMKMVDDHITVVLKPRSTVPQDADISPPRVELNAAMEQGQEDAYTREHGQPRNTGSAPAEPSEKEREWRMRETFEAYIENRRRSALERFSNEWNVFESGERRDFDLAQMARLGISVHLWYETADGTVRCGHIDCEAQPTRLEMAEANGDAARAARRIAFDLRLRGDR